MRIILQPAFVLHYRAYRNTSLLLEILSQDYGRVSLIARGVRTLRSRLKGLLQPFRPLLLSWSGKGDLSNLTTAEEREMAVLLPPVRLFSAFYINELLLHLLHRHDSHPALFEHYGKVLKALASEADEEPVLRIFEKHLLAQLGYGLLLDNDILSGAPIIPEGHYRYVLDRGPVSAAQSRLGISISGKSLLALRHETFYDLKVLREVKQLTRAAIAVQLQGKPLKTRELWLANARKRSKDQALGSGAR